MRGLKATSILVAIIMAPALLLFTHPAHCKGGRTSLYEITKYSRWVSGHKWRYVLVDEDATKSDIQTVYNDLRAKYPNDYFELFNDMDTLVAMYKHSMKKGKFPDPKGHLGMINQMGYDQDWKFTTMSGYSLLKE
jgi:cell wall assembly regulator SMI1